MVRVACVLATIVVVQLAFGDSRSAAQTAPANPYAKTFDHWPPDYQCPGNVIAGVNPDLGRLGECLSDQEKSSTVGIVIDRNAPDSVWIELLRIFESASQVRLVRCDADDQPKKWAELSQACRTLVWWSQTSPSQSVLESLPGQRELAKSLLGQGGTLVFLGQPALYSADRFRNTDGDKVDCLPGLAAMPGAVVDVSEDPSGGQPIAESLSDLPGMVGIAMDDSTLLARRGRIVYPVGSDGAIYFHLPPGIDQDAVTVRYPQDPSSGNRIRQRQANEFLADLTQWRRRAIDLHLPPFPAAEPPQPNVPNGTLVIVGGGGSPAGLMRQFVELAGGAETAKLVYVPCTERDRVSPDQSTIRQWKSMGVQDAVVLHTKDRTRADRDDEFLKPLQDATGIWFGGGRQWNFADSYYGTRAHTMMKAVLGRGGVIGGSSAGASIQADFLARATPIENFDIVAPGYIRGGLGFLPGVAIDQHFTQRRRQSDMSGLIAAYPQVLGIGIDEATAIIVQKSKAEVIGRGDVYFYDADADWDDGYLRLSAGQCFDLASRRACQDE